MKINPLRSFIYILSKNLGTTFIAMLTTPVIVRLLSTGAYGDYAFVLSLMNISMIFINGGISDSLRKFVAEDRSHPGWGNQVFGFYVRLGSLLAGISVIVIVTMNISGLTQQIVDPVFETYFYLLAILLFARQLQKLFRSALMAKGLERVSEPLKILQNITFSGVAIALAYVGYSVSGVLVGHIVASLSVVIIGGYFLSHHYEITSVLRPSNEELPRRYLLSFNIKSVGLILLLHSLYHVDVLLLNPIVGSSEAGYYKAALVISSFLWFAPASIQSALLHSSSEMWSKRDPEAVSDTSAKVTRYNLVFTTLFLLGIAALANPAVPLYFGSDFTASIVPLLILLPGTLGFGMARPIISIGQGKSQLMPLIVATGATSLVNLILNLLLIPPFGLVGAAVSTSVGYGSMVIFSGLAARRIGFAPLSDLRLVRVCGSIGISGIVIFGLANLLGPTLISLLIVPPVGFVVYSVAVLRTRAIAPVEVIDILDNGPDRYTEFPKKIIRFIG